MTLLAFPNVSEGRDPQRIARIRDALAAGATLLDTHSDPDHNRTALTLAGEPGSLAAALAAGAETAIAEIDMSAHEGLHPCVGALDVCAVVYLGDDDRDAARMEAADLAGRIAALEVPVFLYGELASIPERTERAFFRRGGTVELARRIEQGLEPDRGPSRIHPTAGATLVTARPPLAAFNIVIDADAEVAEAIAAELREAGGGLPGVRAIGLPLLAGSQVSTNVHDPVGLPLAEVLARVEELAAAHGARTVSAEIVGLVPAASLAGFPETLPIIGFEPDTHLIERRLAR